MWHVTFVESFVLVKTPGGWKIALGHTNALPPDLGVDQHSIARNSANRRTQHGTAGTRVQDYISLDLIYIRKQTCAPRRKKGPSIKSRVLRRSQDAKIFFGS
jgi:hypothetical protein